MHIPLPTLNAFLNSLSAVLLIIGRALIKRGREKAHRTVMIAALISSTFFLISYITYHVRVGSMRFWGTGALRTVYLSILLTHTLLAVTVVPLALTTFSFAWRQQFARHARWARWTWPLWLYVSVTGVVIYWMLYQMGPIRPV